MTPRLLFAHGWALDRTMWEQVLHALGKDAEGACVLDAGYYGRPTGARPLDGARVLGVGHSLGALELLTQPPTPLAGLAVIDGFARFAVDPDFPQGQSTAVLKAMSRRLNLAPGPMLAEFTAKALTGERPPAGAPDRKALSEGLDRLCTLDGRSAAARLPIWRLHASADPIAPLALADASFSGANARARKVREAADHLSPISDPRACAALIRAALEALSA